MGQTMFFLGRQTALIGLAVLGYFGVRGLTEAAEERANSNARAVLDLERAVGIDLELGLQQVVSSSSLLVDMANWVYIWAHWPLVIATLVWLAVHRLDDFYELRNALFISGAIGLVIYASFAVAPPRLLGLEYVDTVTERSVSYRVLQPPSLVNKYAAVPSLHFGWNLLVGITWHRVGATWFATTAGVVMPIAMGLAVVATANHWVFDVIAGAVVALSGLAIERARRRYRQRPRSARSEPIVASAQASATGETKPGGFTAMTEH